MSRSPALASNRGTLTVHVPMALRKRRGRKVVVGPEGTPAWAPQRPRVESTLVKALARAHRWKRLLESGEFATVADLARAERVNPSYLSRVLRLTLLAPDIVEAILDGRAPAYVTLAALMRPVPVEWHEQL